MSRVTAVADLVASKAYLKRTHYSKKYLISLSVSQFLVTNNNFRKFGCSSVNLSFIGKKSSLSTDFHKFTSDGNSDQPGLISGFIINEVNHNYMPSFTSSAYA